MVNDNGIPLRYCEHCGYDGTILVPFKGRWVTGICPTCNGYANKNPERLLETARREGYMQKLFPGTKNVKWERMEP